MGSKLGGLEVAITECLAHRNEQEWSDDETFSANDVGVVFALAVCTTDVIIKEVDFMVWEGDAKIVDGH